MTINTSSFLYVCAAAIVGTGLLTAVGAAAPVEVAAQSGTFTGPKANTGHVSYAQQGNKHVLTLSADFKVPDTPDPHWQVVDSKGTTYLLDKLTLQGNRVSRSITLPAYINDVQKVVIWCAWAEVNLGEAGFSATLKLR